MTGSLTPALSQRAARSAPGATFTVSEANRLAQVVAEPGPMLPASGSAPGRVRASCEPVRKHEALGKIPSSSMRPRVRSTPSIPPRLSAAETPKPGTRDLLVFGPSSHAADLLDLVEHHGWKPHQVPSAQRATDLLQVTGCRVGLILITVGGQPGVAEAREALAAAKHVKWIAVLPRSVGEEDAGLLSIAGLIHDFHRYPIDPPNLLFTLDHAYRMARLEELSCRRHPPGPHGLVGTSAPMRQLYREMAAAARSDVPVLVVGETGTGKERVARGIHSGSARADGPFVALNCAAVPANLMHSELFGHERGAFTHAFARRTGRLEAADGGTLLLDEVGELRLESQAILLRFLEDKILTPVGGTGARKVDVRIIAATNRDLEQAVRKGDFRCDLYHRLAVLVLRTPPLRDRGDDLVALAEHFMAQEVRNGRRAGFTQEALRALRGYHWPGNVRELRSRIAQAAINAEDGLVTARDLDLSDPPDKAAAPLVTLQQARNSAEKDVIQRTMRTNGGNVARTARQLGVSRMTLYRLLEKHAIV